MRLLTLVFALAFTALLPVARAHDPFEAFHSATLRADRLDLVVTMAQSTALKLIDPAGKIAALTPKNLPEHRAALVREGATLFTLTSASTPLTPRPVEIELTEENDLVFKITYPRPAPGKLYFFAGYMKKLGDGYGGILEVSDAAGTNLGWEQLLWAHPSFELTVPQ